MSITVNELRAHRSRGAPAARRRGTVDASHNLLLIPPRLRTKGVVITVDPELDLMCRRGFTLIELLGRRIAPVGFSVLVACGFARAVDLPPNLTDGIDRANETFEKDWAAVKGRMLKRFDAHDQAVRKAAQPTAADQQGRLATIAAEKDRFEKYGLLPFSGPMRDDSLAYLKEVNAARAPALKAYDEGVKHLRAMKDDAGAAELTAAMRTRLGPKLVGVWVCTTPDKRKNMEVDLFDDYTIWADARHSWSLTAGGFVTSIKGGEGGTASYAWTVGGEGDTALSDKASPLTYQAFIPERRRQ